MKKKLGHILVLLTLYSMNLQANDSSPNSFKEYLRPYMLKFLGEETTMKILGPPPETIVLPTIPQISKNAKSTAGMSDGRHLDKEVPKEKKDRYYFTFLQELYQVTLNRAPSEEELSKWMNTLEQGAALEGIYRAIVLGTEYDELERSGGGVEDSAIKFSQNYLQKYINLKVDEKGFREMNIHSMKRICVEKSLELIDVFGENIESLYDWYAVLSGELAKHYSAVLPGNLRSNPSLKVHKKWASSVPLDFIRAEVIIKLHKVFNSLR